MMHANSRISWERFDSETRNYQVCDALSVAKRPVTDREIVTQLGSEDMNYARPSITGLIDAGFIVEVGQVVCKTTSHLVRTIRLATPEERDAHQPGTQKCDHARLWRELCSSLNLDPCKTNPAVIAGRYTHQQEETI